MPSRQPHCRPRKNNFFFFFLARRRSRSLSPSRQTSIHLQYPSTDAIEQLPSLRFPFATFSSDCARTCGLIVDYAAVCQEVKPACRVKEYPGPNLEVQLPWAVAAARRATYPSPGPTHANEPASSTQKNRGTSLVTAIEAVAGICL